MLIAQIIEILQSLKPEIRREYKAELKGIFGSQARGEAAEESDIDILVEFQEDATFFDLVRMGDFLEERLRQKVDIVSRESLREEIRPHVYQDLISL